MKIQVFKIDEYRECPIYYRNFKDHFEYLVIIKNQLYTAHVRVRPHWITKACFLLDLTTSVDKIPYSQQQLKNILTHLRRMAEATIDTVLDKKE